MQVHKRAFSLLTVQIRARSVPTYCGTRGPVAIEGTTADGGTNHDAAVPAPGIIATLAPPTDFALAPPEATPQFNPPQPPSTRSRYTYANNSPMDMFDPDGRFAGSLRRLVKKISGVFDRPATRTSSRSTSRSSNRFLEINGVYERPAPKPTSPWRPTRRFLEINGATPAAPAPQPRFTPSAHFLEINSQLSTVTTELVAQSLVVGSMAREADVDFATMRSSLNCVQSDECGGEELIEALTVMEGTEYGQLIFGTIDVAKQQDWDKADGNWSEDDIRAASDMSAIQQFLKESGAPAEMAAMHASTVSSVANRLAQTDGGWEDLDVDRSWYQGAVDTFRDWSDEAVLVLGVATVFGCVACGFVAAGISTVSAADQCANSSGSECAVGVTSAALSITGAGASLTSIGLGRAGAGSASASDDFGFAATDHLLQGHLVRGFGNGAASHYTGVVAVRLGSAGQSAGVLSDDLAKLSLGYDALAWAGS